MRTKTLRIAAALGLVWSLATASWGQEATFPDLLSRWKQLEASLEGLQQDYRFAQSAEEQRDVIEEYNQTAAQVQTTLVDLRAAAIAAFQSDPASHPELAETLLQLAAWDFRRDRVEDAQQILDLLEPQAAELPGWNNLAGMVAYHRDEFRRAKELLTAAQEEGSLSLNAESYLDDVDEAIVLWDEEQVIRERELAAQDLPRVRISTTAGDVVVQLYENQAPQTVANFISLIEAGFYEQGNGLTFHRVLNNFMAQGGCPTGDGTGDAGHNIYCECYREDYRHHFRGTLSMAHSGRDTGSSQFFITFLRTAHLDGRHTAFGRIVEGMDVLQNMQRINPQRRNLYPEPTRILKMEILRKRDHEYEPTIVADPATTPAAGETSSPTDPAPSDPAP